MFGVDGAEVERAGLGRARAMALRDARGVAISEADRTEIERELCASYETLKRAVAPRRGGA